MMNAKQLSLAGVVAVVAMSSVSPAALANNDDNDSDRHDRHKQTFKFDVPIVDLNNPCTPGHDSIDGTLHVKAVLKLSDDKRKLVIRAKGDAESADGVDYDAKAKLIVKFHDPFPARIFLKAKLISESSGEDDAVLNVRLHVNEQGNITNTDIDGIECRDLDREENGDNGENGNNGGNGTNGLDLGDLNFDFT